MKNILPPSSLPVLASLALLCLAQGVIGVLHKQNYALYILALGVVSLLTIIMVWLVTSINDLQGATKSRRAKSDVVYRWSMFWFIFSEVWFFIALFGILFYTRFVTIPTLAGTYPGDRLTHYLLWPNFSAQWPLLVVPDPSRYTLADGVLNAFGFPLINTIVLVSSGVSITIAHWALLEKKRFMAISWQLVTALLGVIFLYLQYHEYVEAYSHYGLRLDSGMYASVFYFLTGFHGLHVLLGTIMLLIVACRMFIHNHLSESFLVFEIISWYWHFVDVVWLLLFVFVYWV